VVSPKAKVSNSSASLRGFAGGMIVVVFRIGATYFANQVRAKSLTRANPHTWER
jgi:hypothetical protein